ncbi:MAG: DNA alkylation repair protein [Thermosipho sp. (in: Bacteria)]|nr:DNA alkylation repair protein [Thermosipho sp. (in: thermotogales)]
MKKVDQNLSNLINEIREKKDETKAKFLEKYFKAFPGGYGEGDKFLGIKVPILRKIAKKYANISFEDVEQLLKSEYHEERLIALFILIYKSKENLEKAVEIYLNNLDVINNWDLIDTTAPKILGPYFKNKDKSLLYEFAKSSNIWKQRIAILTTFHYIKEGDFNDALKIIEILLLEKHDLINKATGWALREIGKKDKNTLLDFIKKRYNKLSRTTLRYAIERFDETERKNILKGIF